MTKIEGPMALRITVLISALLVGALASFFFFMSDIFDLQCKLG